MSTDRWESDCEHRQENDKHPVANSIVQEIVFCGKMKIRLFQD